MALVVGGTGDLGSRVVRHLVAAGEPVRAVVRPASDAGPLRTLGAEVVPGDLADPAGPAGWCAEGETVVVTATAIGRLLAGARRPTIDQVDRDGTLRLVTGAERAGAARVVYVSYAGVETSFGSPIESAKRAVEARLRQSPLRTVLIRPDAFQEVHLAPLGRFDVAAGKVTVIGTGDSPRRWVATEDVAALVAALALEPDPPEVVEVGGPEALTRNEAVAVAADATGHRVRRQRVPAAVARTAVRALGPRRGELASVLGMSLMMDAVPASWDDGPLRERGITPRGAGDWIRQQARQPTAGGD